MYKRHTGQVSMLESPEMFGSLPLDPKKDWIKMSKLVPWREFDVKYAENFRSQKGQRAIDSRMALGVLLIKPANLSLAKAIVQIVTDDGLRKLLSTNFKQWFENECSYRIIAGKCMIVVNYLNRRGD